MTSSRQVAAQPASNGDHADAHMRGSSADSLNSDSLGRQIDPSERSTDGYGTSNTEEPQRPAASRAGHTLPDASLEDIVQVSAHPADCVFQCAARRNRLTFAEVCCCNMSGFAVPGPRQPHDRLRVVQGGRAAAMGGLQACGQRPWPHPRLVRHAGAPHDATSCPLQPLHAGIRMDVTVRKPGGAAAVQKRYALCDNQQPRVALL